MTKRRGNNNRGGNKRPDFASAEEAAFFEKTPKHVLFDMLRQSSVLHVSLGVDGYLDTWPDDPSLWMQEARRILGGTRKEG